MHKFTMTGQPIQLEPGPWLKGQWIQSFLMSGRPLKWKNTVKWESSKIMNKSVKIVNGNRISRNILKIVHWEYGEPATGPRKD